MDNLKMDVKQLQEINKYPDIIESVLKYVYASLKKHDITDSTITDIMTLDVINDYEFDDVYEHTSIIDIKESYLSSDDVDDTIKNAIIHDTKLNNILTSIDKDLNAFIDNRVTPHFKEKIKSELNDLIKRESNSSIQSTITKELESNYDIISVYDVNSKKHDKKVYRFSYQHNSYILFNENDLELLFNECNDEVRLLPKTLNNILSRVSTTQKIKRKYVEFENVYIDPSTFDIINKNIDNRFFTENKLYHDVDDTYRLFKYHPDVTLGTLDAIDVDTIPTVKVLKEITIPKDNPDDDKLFRFIIQMIGVSLSCKNSIKTIPIFLDDGSKGKTTIVNILSIIFNSGIETIDKKVFNDNFTVETLNNAKYCFVNDEFKFKEFTQYNNEYKLLSGAGFYSGRGFMSSESKKVTELPFTWLFTNDTPYMDLNDTALLDRILLITLPNRFIDNNGITELKTNEYYRDTNIKSKIESDYNGLSILLSLAINEYKRMLENDDIDKTVAFKQSKNEKLQIIGKEDPLTLYLVSYVQNNIYNVNPNNYISTDDILTPFKAWYRKIYDENAPEVYLNKQKLGNIIKNIYPNVDKVSNPAKYNLRILTDDEVIKDKNKIITIIDRKYKGTSLDNMIIKHIERGINTKNKLLSEIPDENQSILLTTIDNLYSEGVIDITFDSDIESFV